MSDPNAPHEGGRPDPPPGPAGPPGYGLPGDPGFGPGYPPAHSGQPGHGYPAPQTDQTAIWALVLAISAFVVCPVVPAIVALVLSGSAERSIAASGGMRTGEGLVRAARIVSWIHIGLVLAVLVLGIGLASVGLWLSTTP